MPYFDTDLEHPQHKLFKPPLLGDTLLSFISFHDHLQGSAVAAEDASQKEAVSLVTHSWSDWNQSGCQNDAAVQREPLSMLHTLISQHVIHGHYSLIPAGEWTRLLAPCSTVTSRTEPQSSLSHLGESESSQPSIC